MPEATLTSKGQLTLPKAIRDHLGIEKGDRVAFSVLESGAVILEPENADIRSLRGVLKHRGKRVTVEQMNDAIRKRASSR